MMFPKQNMFFSFTVSSGVDIFYQLYELSTVSPVKSLIARYTSMKDNIFILIVLSGKKEE